MWHRGSSRYALLLTKLMWNTCPVFCIHKFLLYPQKTVLKNNKINISLTFPFTGILLYSNEIRMPVPCCFGLFSPSRMGGSVGWKQVPQSRCICEKMKAREKGQWGICFKVLLSILLAMEGSNRLPGGSLSKNKTKHFTIVFESLSTVFHNRVHFPCIYVRR